MRGAIIAGTERQARVTGFEWDERKRLIVLEKHGIDFVDAAQTLMGTVYEYTSQRNNEHRFVAIGPGPAGQFIAIIYTIRGERIRIITARRARKDEQVEYIHAVSASPDEGQD